ncbi:DnaB-like helicase N-terminal domain-containing protein [Scytonema sp. PCC 10023]|uniref:AAA family ATPase n=1 Tax=Scytonema sp. PCC 10023 TaxID=1680591 RepID=UPI0039C5BC36
MYAPSEQPEFRPALGLPPSNPEIEEVTLGGCMLDPEAIVRIKDIITADAFYIPAHKDIYQAILALHKQNKPTDLLSVINWLADHDLLTRVGGRNKLGSLIDRTVSAVNINYHADALVEKYLRRELISRVNKIEAYAHETDKPLTWIMENTENLILPITQMRKQDSKGYWQQWDKNVFERLCKDLSEVEEIENTAQRDWAFRKMAKKWKFGNKKELLDFHAKWLDSQESSKVHSAKEYFQQYGQSEQSWLIPGFIPADSVVVLYADGGVGKTRLAFSLAKAAVSGGTFAYEGTEFEPMNTLLIETDQGPINTAKLLEMHDFLEDGISNRLAICDEWTVGEFGRLKTMLKQHQPKLVIVDSLTSVSVDSLYSENDTEYARPLVRLRHLAKEFGCTFLVIHHSNAQGGIRGTRAIKNTVDEVFKFTKQQNELGEFNVLTIEKTRSRGPGNYKFTYDDDTWGWKFGGLIEEEFLGGSNGTTNMMRCIKFLSQNKGTPYQALEVAEALGLPKDSVRRDLRRAATEGLVNSGRSTHNKRALVYYVGARKQTLPNARCDQREQVDQIDHISLITSFSAQEQDFGRCDQVGSKSLPFSCPEENQKACPLDHMITSNATHLPESIDSKVNEQNKDVISDMINDAIAPEKSDQTPPSERSHVTSLNEEVLTEVGEEVGKNDDSEKLSALPTSSRETAIDGELAVGEEVKVLAGDTKHLQKLVGKVLPIGTINNDGLWLKEGKGFSHKLVGPYQAHQIKRSSQ